MAEQQNGRKEWTLMFYFASDNPLGPGIVSQLKAIKNAGFHQGVNVVTQFDPNTKDTPTHVFDVNLYNKIEKYKETCKFFAGNDPYIRNLVLDRLWSDDDVDGKGKSIRVRIAESLKASKKNGDNANGLPMPDYNPPIPPKLRLVEGSNEEPGPKESLGEFLKFCAREYPARHYMLFIIGHGVVVGNDLFLYDENASEHSLKLKNLAEVLGTFHEKLRESEVTKDSELELIGFHSCSMSALEVACELHGLANYMLASEGSAFVGSWPYREILIRVFNDLLHGRTGPEQIKETIERIFDYILKNSYDFQLAGYSFELCMCDLRQVTSVSEPLNRLAQLMVEGLRLDDETLMERDPLVKERILLAHWDAQSYWQESYTDLYDFCFCLQRRCREALSANEATQASLRAIAEQCDKVIAVLEKEKDFTDGAEKRNKDGSKRLIIRAEFVGPVCQYSHGLSIYFPWSRPVDSVFWTQEYPDYRLNKTELDNSAPAVPLEEDAVFEAPWTWAGFLKNYFVSTRRNPVWEEYEVQNGQRPVSPTIEQELLEELTKPFYEEKGLRVSFALGPSNGPGDEKPGPNSGMGNKPGGGSGTGGECDCPSIKNYPSVTRRDKLPASRGFFTTLWSDG